jgi:hypothetical protein
MLPERRNVLSETTQKPNTDRPDQGPPSEIPGYLLDSASEQGMILVELPQRKPDPWTSEKIFVRDFGPHVTRRVEAEFANLKTMINYNNTKPHEPASTFAHYTGVAKGLGLLDARNMTHMERLARRLAESTEPEKFFNESVRPFLLSLRPGRR